MNFDLIVAGGTVATDSDVSTVDIGVTDDRVIALLESAERAGATAARRLDATGQLVVPSRAAAYGGTTRVRCWWRDSDSTVRPAGRRSGATAAEPEHG